MSTVHPKLYKNSPAPSDPPSYLLMMDKETCCLLKLLVFSKWFKQAKSEMKKCHIWGTPSDIRGWGCVCSVLHAHAQFCRFDKADATADVHWQVAITDRHSDTTIFQLRAHWVRISWSIGSEKLFGHVPTVGVKPSTSCMQGEHPIH